MNTLVLTIGLPRSGKSTWSRAQGVPIVNPDSIRLAIHGQPFFAPAEPLVWTTAKLMVRALFLAGHDTVILDATNTTSYRRDEWASREWTRQYVCFDTPVAVCHERATAAGQDYLHAVIDRMAKEMEWPAHSIGGLESGTPKRMVVEHAENQPA